MRTSRCLQGFLSALSPFPFLLDHVTVSPFGEFEASPFTPFPLFLRELLGFGYSLRCYSLTLHRASSLALSRNPFVETALSYALTYISSILPTHHIKPTTVTILADNDYYSQPSNPSSSSPSPTPDTKTFADFHVRLQDAHKTGLGSSAALVTAFTGALLTHYLPSTIFTFSSETGRKILHNLAQAAHCAAQGKVGSGFDVATAVYGTCVYRRFSPSVLSSLGDPGSAGFSTRVRNIVDDTNEELKWDTEIQKEGVTIPNGMALVMCDVDCGSQTVGMVKKVLEWRKSDPSGSKKLWDELQTCNETLGRLLTSGSSSKKEFEGAFEAIRSRIREMGSKSGVPIEPPEQTELLDGLTKGVDGVAGGVVPGAGGYDAVVLLVKDDRETLGAIEKFLVEWSKEKGSNVKLLGTKGELEGVRKEDGGKYGAWVK